MIAAAAAWACAQGPGPLVMRAVLSSFVAVGLYLALIFLTRRELTLTLARQYWPWIRRGVLRRGKGPGDNQRLDMTSPQTTERLQTGEPRLTAR